MSAGDTLALLPRRDRDFLERLARDTDGEVAAIAAALLSDTLQTLRDHHVLPSGRRVGALLRRPPSGR